MYSALIAFQLGLAFVIPGYQQEGLPVPSLGYKTLMYNCNGLWCWYTTIIVVAGVQYFGIFNLADIIDNFGHLMTVAMIVGFVVSFAAYFITIALGMQLRMSGNFIYDVWMGAILNPRLGSIDLKMWLEVRIPWVLMWLMAVSGAVKQHQQYGYVTPVRCSIWFVSRSPYKSSERILHDSCNGSVYQRLRQGRGAYSTNMGHVLRKVRIP
jgi:delta24(24(1))-sterol reductase